MKMLLATVATLVIVLPFLSFSSEKKVSFLDVGQGDAILFTNGSNQILIDGGQGMAVLEELGREMSIFDKKIEVLILTHPQRDHLEGLLHVFERYDVELVILPKAAHESLLQEEWINKIMAQGADYVFAKPGQEISLGDISMNILAPFDTSDAEAAIKADLNNASVVARVDFCPKENCLSFLLTGDMEKRAEKIIVNNTPHALLDVDVLKVGHHGSDSSTHQDLLAATTPRAAVISVGSDNKFGHPRQEVLDRLGDIPTFRTDKGGTVSFKFIDGKWLVASGQR